MITVGMYYDILPGKEKIFEEKFAEVLEALQNQPEHVQSILYRQVTNPYSYTIFSEWKSKGGFTAFIHSDIFKEVTNWGYNEILTKRPHHKVYERDKE